MTLRKFYNVRLLPSGRWSIGFEGAGRPSASADSEEAAIRRARQLARLAGSDLIVVHEPDGSIRLVTVEAGERLER
jgi:hypothetical protein